MYSQLDYFIDFCCPFTEAKKNMKRSEVYQYLVTAKVWFM